MNFKKNKDVKRASYYVWFLGSKESKGLRGDEYVSPVLNYMLDNECDLEPSKVTLQVSKNGLKIIQILTVPRKSSKLSADQQTQLFANSRRLKDEPSATSALKTEQMKHHIPHNSITWVYQEEDIICAILLLYNPITRCPVHVHAYRCDSIETADNLRQQLQALVARPENQKKFHDIESRLAAKGLLLPPNNYTFPEEEVPLPQNAPPFNEAHRYNSANKTLNSDGRSTRTEGSDENSEESNSSDLGYAIRSKNLIHGLNGYNKHIPPPPPMLHNSQKLSKIKNAQVPVLMPFKSNKSKPVKSKSKKPDEEPEAPLGVTAALYDSLAAELRAKLGNPKMGPILLPPRDYDKASVIAAASSNKNKTRSKQKLYPLTRSESSGKSSSGIGSDETLSNENQAKKSQLYRHYREMDMHGPQSFIDIDRYKRSSGCMYGGENEKPLYSLQMNVYSSDEDEFDSNDVLQVNGEDIEEEVIFTANHNRKSKSSFDLSPKYKPLPHMSANQIAYRPVEPKYVRQAQIDPYIERKQSRSNNLAKIHASNPNLSRVPLKEVKQTSDKSAFVIGRREQRTLQQGHPNERIAAPTAVTSFTSAENSRQLKPPQKFYFADAEFSDPKPHMSLLENEKKLQNQRYLGRSSGNLANLDYNNSGPTSLGYHQANIQLDRSSSPQFFYSPRQETRFEPAPKSRQFVPSKSSSNLTRGASSRYANDNYDHELAMRKKLEQPFSRYSYIDVDHHNRESRFNYVPSNRR